METVWYEKEEDWVLKLPIIFNKGLVMGSFIEVDRIIKLLGGCKDTETVLDLCCGIGRHSLQLARHGFKVTGVDITKPYLAIARQNAEKAGLEIDWQHADMRQFCQPGHFDLVVNLCTSFGYFEDTEDDLKVLRNIYRSLKPSGKFMIEILGKEVIASTFNPLYEFEAEGCQVIAESEILNDWTRLKCKRTILKEGVKTEVLAYHKLYSATELKTLLQAVGFKNIKVYGDFGGSPYDNKARSMIMISAK